jgi:hypothetical protein
VKVLLALLLLCSTADAGRRCHTRCQASLQKQLNRKWENENGITAKKWDCRLNRSRALLNFSKPFNIWGWLIP